MGDRDNTDDFKALEQIAIDLPNLKLGFLTPKLQGQLIALQDIINNLQQVEQWQADTAEPMFPLPPGVEEEGREEIVFPLPPSMTAEGFQNQVTSTLLSHVPELKTVAAQLTAKGISGKASIEVSQEAQAELSKAVQAIHDKVENKLEQLTPEAQALTEAQVLTEADRVHGQSELPEAMFESAAQPDHKIDRYFIKSQILANTYRFLGFKDSADYLEARIFKEKYVLPAIEKLTKRYSAAKAEKIPQSEIKKIFGNLIKSRAGLKEADLAGIEDVQIKDKADAKFQLLSKFSEVSGANGSKFLQKTCSWSAVFAKSSILEKASQLGSWVTSKSKKPTPIAPGKTRGGLDRW